MKYISALQKLSYLRPLLLFLAVVSISNAFSYSKDQIRLTDYEYKVRVRPQLKNIHQDYQTLLSYLNEDLKPYKKLFPSYQNLLADQTKLFNACKVAGSENCTPILNEVLANTKKILQEMELPPPAVGDTKQNLTTILSLKLFNELKDKVFDYYMLLFNFHFLYKAEIHKPQQVYIFKRKRFEVYYQFNMYIISLLPEKFEDSFQSFWNDFMRPISSDVIFSTSKDEFVIRLNQLNMSFNIFHAYMAKRNHVEVDRKIKTLLQVMHNRWNNILKATLR